MRYPTLLFVVALMLSGRSAFAQTDYSKYLNNPAEADTAEKNNHSRFKPLLRRTEAGGAIGIFAGPAPEDEPLQVNGVNFEADLIPLFASFLALAYVTDMIKSTEANSTEADNDDVSQVFAVTIKGLSIGTGTVEEDSRISGVAINGTCGMPVIMQGVEISGLFNTNKVCDGIAIAPVNVVVHGRGVEAGIVNSCSEGRLLQVGVYNLCRVGSVVQIGLINTIGSRTTPFVNFRFKHRKKVG